VSDQDADDSVRHAEPNGDPEEEDEPKPKPSKRPPQFIADVDLPELGQIIEDARYALVEWWNESRYSKHGKKAAWTEKAWLSNVDVCPACLIGSRYCLRRLESKAGGRG